MKTDTTNEQLIRRYLLGNSSDVESEALEARFIENDVLFDEMSALEDELYVEYAAGELSEQERTSFESRFLRTAQDRQRAAFADAFVATTADLAAAAAPNAAAEMGRATLLQAIGAFFGISSTTVSYGMAAASLLLVIGAAYLLVQNSRTRDSVASIDNEKAADRQEQESLLNEKLRQQAELDRQLKDQKDREQANQQKVAAIEADRDRLKNEIDEKRRKLDQMPATPSRRVASGSNPIVALVLSPGRFVRSDDGDDTSRLKLTPNAKSVSMTLVTKNVEAYRSYRAVVRSVDDARDVFSSGDLKTRSGKAGKSVRISIPAARLAQADYEVSLLGVKSDRSTEELTRYYFSVIK